MKLFHWKCLSPGHVYNFMVMSESVENARAAIKAQIAAPAGARARNYGCDAVLDDAPNSVRDADDPLVLWTR